MEALHALGIDFKVMIAQIVNFGILLFVLTKLLYRPILEALEKRRKRIEGSLKKAEEIEAQSAHLKEEMERRRVEALNETSALIAEAKADAEKDREKIVAAAAQEAERLKKEAREQMGREREALHEETKKQVGKLALLIVTQSLSQDLGEEFYEKNINRALDQIEAIA